MWAVRAKVEFEGHWVWCLACASGWVPIAMCFAVPLDPRHMARYFRTAAIAEQWARAVLGARWPWEVVTVRAYVPESGVTRVKHVGTAVTAEEIYSLDGTGV